MIVENHRNAFPEIIESILMLARPNDIDCIFSIKNHEGSLELIFKEMPDSDFVNLIKSIWFYSEQNENYSLSVLTTLDF